MDAVAVTIQYGRYRATVHYESCAYYKSTYHHSKLSIPPSMRVVVCKKCEPTAQAIAKIADEISWLEKRADAMSLRAYCSWDEVAEEMDARKQLHGGGRRDV